VGAPETVKQALRSTREKGTLVLIGAASKVEGLDLALLWTKEIRFQGAVGYGEDEYKGERAHTFEWLMKLYAPLASKAERMITHTFPLASHTEAFRAALDRSGGRSVKVLFSGA
jgi:threonine dehydrogenase-like Zn-dependent dehydrogenase